MSQTIDSRVVEMKFDNKNFEKNVAESMKTLEELDKRLTKLEQNDVQLDGIKKAFDGFDLSKVDKALDSITNRFSVLGQVGASVIHNLTSDAYNLVKTFSSNVWNTTFGQIKSGGMSRAQNIEQAKFLLEGTGIAFEKVESSIDKAVKDTAFGFDEAAQAAAGLAAAGVDIGESMDTALLSISGVASMTNRSYSDIADIFQDAAAAGKASADTFGRLAERGLAAKSVLMEYLDIADSDQFDKLAKAGGISFETFAQAMYDNYAAQAKKSNETLNGVIANTRAALSRMGQSFYQPIMANNSDVVLMFQSLKKVLSDLKPYTDLLAKSMSDYVLKLARFGKGILDSIDVAKFEPVFQNLVKIFDNLTKAAENLYSNILKPLGKQFTNALYEVFPSLNTGKGLLITISDKLVEASQRFREFTADIGLFGEKGIAVKDILKGIFTALKIVISVAQNFKVALKPLIDLLGSLAKVIANAIGGIGSVLSGALINAPSLINAGANIVAGILAGILSGIATIGKVVVALGTAILNQFLTFFGIHSPSKLMMLLVGVPIVAGIAAGIILGKDKVLEAIDVLGSIIQNGMVKIVDLMFLPFGLIGKKIAEPFKIISEFVKNTAVYKIISLALESVVQVLTLLNVVLGRVINSVQALDNAGFNKMLGQIKALIITIITMVSLNKMSNAINAFGVGIGSIGKAISSGLKAISTSVKAYARAQIFGKLADIFKNLAIAVVAITGSILIMGWAIGNPERWESIKKGLIIIGSIVAILVGIAATFGGLATKFEGFQGKNLSGFALAVVGIASAIFLVASAIKKVSKLDWTQIGVGFLGIIGLFIAVAAAIAKFKKVSGGEQSTKHDWLLVASFGVTISLLASAIKKVSLLAMFNPAALTRATAAIASLVGIFGIIAIAMEALSKLKIGEVGNMGMLKEMPLTFLAIGTSVNMIASAIKKLAKIPEEDLQRAFDKIESIMLLIAAIVGLAHFAQAAVSKMLLSVAALVATCGLVIYYLGEIQNEEVINRGFGILVKMGMGILAFCAALQSINRFIGGGDSDLKTLLYISSIIVACGGMIALVNWIGADNVWSAMGILGVLGAGILAFIGVLQLITRKSTQLTKSDLFDLHKSGKKGIVDKITQFGQIITMINTIVKSISRLAITMAIVSRVVKDWDQVFRAIALMATVMVPIVGTLLLLDNIDTGGGENIKGLAKAITSVTAMILVIAGSLLVLSNMPFNEIMAAAIGLLSVIAVLGFLINAVNKTEESKVNYKSLIAATAMIAAVGASLWALTYFNQDEAGFKRIAAACIGIALCIAAIGFAFKLAKDFKADIKTGVSLVIAASSLLVIAGALALLAHFNVDWQTAAIQLVALGTCIVAVGIALNLAKGVKWQAAAGILAGAFSLVLIAQALAMVAQYSWQDLLPSFLALSGIVVILGGILAGLTLLASSGIGAVGIVIVAAAIAILAASLIGIAFAMEIAVNAMSKFIAIFNQTTAENILAFFNTIGDGIGPAAQKIMDGLKVAVKAIRDGMAEIKAETSEVGFDFVQGFATGISKFAPLVGVAAAALGLAALFSLKGSLRSKSPSKETYDVGGDYDTGLANGIDAYASIPNTSAQNVGLGIIDTLKNAVSNGLKSTSFKDIWGGIKAEFSDWNVVDSMAAPAAVIKKLTSGVGKAFAQNGFAGLQEGLNKTASSGGIMSAVTGLITGNGSFDDLLGGFDWSSILGEGGIGQLGNYLKDAGGGMDALSGDNIPKLINKLKEAGLAGDDLTNALKELGITEEQLKGLGLVDALGLEEAKDGAEDLKTSIQDLADEIIKGKFGNAPERWDRMFEALVKSGKTAQEAYAAIADAQNEVNKRLGNSTVHTAEEMEKKVSDSVKKANEATAKANEGKKEPRDFKKDPYKTTPLTAQQKADISSAADQQMMNNMPYENYKAIKAGQVTKEYEKQTAEAYKQKLANEHIYSLKEKENALAAIAANNQKLQSTGVTDEARKQLEAENQRYQKVVNTYNTQREMIKAIEEQETATKKAEAAEKKRGDAIKAAEGAVVYGSAEYYNQTGKNGTTINNQAARTAVSKSTVATKPVQTEVKAEAKVKVEPTEVDATSFNTAVVTKLEAEAKNLQAKVEITPKINTAQAEAQIKNFKSATEELKTSIPQTFNGIAEKVSTHISSIAAKISSEGSKISANTKTVFQNAVNSATTVLTSSATIDKFYKAGKQATDGYVRGLKANLAAVKSAASEIANASANAAKKALKEKSPSRVFMGIGGYAGEGYVIGLRQYSSAVEAASSDMAQSSIDGVYRVVDAVQNAVNEGMDITPSITPVFDAANIQNEIGSVNSMMDLSNRDLASISANIDAKANYDNSQVEEMQNRMDTMRTAFNDLADILMNQPTPEVNANVVLQGDAAGVFKLVRNENTVYTKMHGKSALA